MHISVVIPHLNQPEALQRCLNSIASGDRKPDEVIVVDNGSSGLPDEICARAGAVLLQETMPGPGPARNLGVTASSGDVLAFIDADCVAAPGWLAAAEAALSDPDANILGGDVRIAQADPARQTMLEAYESIYAYRMDQYIARMGFTGTGNLVVRRRVLDEVGEFAGKAVAEDRDWGRRATAKGYRIHYVADMRVYHPARPDFAGLKVKWDRHVAHDFVAASARPGGRLRFAVKSLVMWLSPLAEIGKIARSDRVSGLRARVLAFAGLSRIRLYRARIMMVVLLKGHANDLSGAWNQSQEP